MSSYEKTKGYILEIKGILDNKGITIKSKKRTLTIEQKKKIAEALRKGRFDKH